MNSKFHANISEILEIDIPKIDLIHGFPLFTGHVNLARYLFFYDLYKEVYKLSGDIADVGTWKGYSFLFFAKLVKIFEPLAFTRVHAYDWFQGMLPQVEDDTSHEGEYIGGYDMLCKLIELHELSGLAVVNKLDLAKDLPEYFKNKENRSLRFKLCFIDCGIKNVLEESLKYFYPRIIKGGIVPFLLMKARSLKNMQAIIKCSSPLIQGHLQAIL
jgi:hypothetical protein